MERNGASPGPGFLGVEADQFTRSVEATSFVYLMGTAAAALVCWAFWDTAAQGALTGWLALFVLVTVVRVVSAQVFLRSGDQARHMRAWAVGGLLLAMSQSVLWGALSLILLTPARPEQEVVLHAVLCAIAMGAALHLSGATPVLLAYVTGVLGPLMLRDLLIGDVFHLLLATMCLLALAHAVVLGRHQARALAEILAQRRRNAQLVAELQAENARSEAARRAAEEASAARSRFFAAANHDLRQPLHAMGLLAQTLHSGASTVRVSDVAQHLSGCVEGMTEVVDDLLEITRLDVGQLQPQWTVFELRAMLEECCRSHQAVAHAKGLTFEFSAEPLSVRSDRTLLTRVVSNLLSNAIRYTPAGTVRLTARAEGACVDLRVEDTGIGIAPEHLPRIFEEFYQVGNPARDRRLGLGLGLATVKRLGELLGLEVSVDSAPGRGSVFVLRLPRVSGPSPADALTGPAAVAEPLVSDSRVLVIEDDADSREALVGLLSAWGCDVRGVAGLAGAMSLLASGYEPDALIADLRLADGASGVDAVRALRAALERDVAALIVTGDAGSDTVGDARAAGLAVATKPVRALQLRAFLSQALATS